MAPATTLSSRVWTHKLKNSGASSALNVTKHNTDENASKTVAEREREREARTAPFGSFRSPGIEKVDQWKSSLCESNGDKAANAAEIDGTHRR